MELKIRTFEQLNTRELYGILRARAEVFVAEQKIICADPDGVDLYALHCFFEDNDKIIAYLRAYPAKDGTVKIGRVLTTVRGKGYGVKIMRESIPYIAKLYDCKSIRLNAQKYAEGFYQKLGFVTVSDEFLEEGVVHVAMEKKI